MDNNDRFTGPAQIAMTPDAYHKLLHICNEAYPQEACGLLISTTSSTIDCIHPLRNAHTNPLHSFRFDPHDWVAAYYSIQKNRQTLVGFFHSHPTTKPVPSSKDLEGFPGGTSYTYWIISLHNKKQPLIQVYQYKRGQLIALMPAEISV